MGVLNKLFPGSQEYPKNSAGKNIALGFQHAFAMSCATILVPLLTGLDVGVALFAAGVGTLIFHLCTGGRMPTFLGSSFAFIAAILGVVGNSEFGATKEEQIAAAMGGVIAAGVLLLAQIRPILESPVLQPAFDNILPALFGGLAIVYVTKNAKLAAAPLIFMVALFICVPSLSSSVGMMVPVGVIIAIVAARIMYNKGILNKKEKKQ